MKRLVVVLVLFALAPSYLPGADGALEINQACALQGGCFPGDPAGFPVTLSGPGKYVLTGDLNHDPAVHGDVGIISINAADVTIDLNGFALSSTSSCEIGACDTGNVYGISGLGRPRANVRNGRVTGVDNSCVLLGDQARVENLTVSHCSLIGIGVGANSIVEGVSVGSTGRNGLSAGFTGTIYRNGTFSDNGLREDVIGSLDVTSSVTANARAVGKNVCADNLCGDGRPRYYRSKASFDGAEALNACDAGFHMASVWELLDPSRLSYDVRRGHVRDDSGDGAPDGSGWIRTGGVLDGGQPGLDSCSAWTSADAGQDGSFGGFANAIWTERIEWTASSMPCNQDLPLWCVED